MVGGLFGVISRKDFAKDLFFGVDYHSHLGTETGGLAFLDGEIHAKSKDISNSQFKSEFLPEYNELQAPLGIGVISDIAEEQPIKFESNIGTFALCTIGLIRNLSSIYREQVKEGSTFKKSRIAKGKTLPNQTEIVGELISSGKDVVDGIETMYEKIDGTISLLLLSQDDRSIYASAGVFPLTLGRKDESWAITSETSAFLNLGYQNNKILENREIISLDESGLRTRIKKYKNNKFCPFLHLYYGFPASEYYGINAEIVRERCGGFLAKKDDVKADLVLGIADSGFAHALGYVKQRIEIARSRVSDTLERYNKGEITMEEFSKSLTDILNSIIPLRRPLIKYTPGWGRSYIPPTRERRELIAKYKQVPNPQIIKDKRIILIDDSIRRGTQLRDLIKEKILPYKPDAIHGRIASPPQIYPCIFDLSTKIQDLATSKSLKRSYENIDKSIEPIGPEYDKMVEEIRKMIGFTTLKFQTVGDLIKAVINAPNNKELKKEDLCLYCWTGKF